jgi:predicted permease
MDTLLRDVRYAVRGLLRSPGFSAVAVLTLTLGIGATTAIFSVFDAVLLRPLPYRSAEQLYAIHEVGREGNLIPVNALHFREWRAATRSFDDMALVGPETFDLSGAGDAVRVSAARVTPSLFRTLGIEPALGRPFLEGEDIPGRDRVVILGHELWTTRFASDPAVIGRRVTLDGQPYDVVGVLPQGSELPSLQHLYALEAAFDGPQIWKPFAATENDLRLLGNFNYAAIGRLKPGVTPAQATDDLNAVETDLARRVPEPAEFRAAMIPLADQIVSRSNAALRLVLTTVVLVLLIACVNITNLLLARGGGRHRELAIRRAAGAGPLRLMVHAAMEGVVLSVVAGVAALVMASALVRVIRLNAPVDVPRIEEAGLNPPVLLFTFAVTVCTALLIGFLPAWRAVRVNSIDLLRSASTTAMSGRAGGRLRSVLVSVEVAASAACLIAAALLVTSFARLMSVDRGFQVERITTVDLVLPSERYDDAAGVRFITTLADRVRALPGVMSAGVTDALPLRGLANSAIMVEGSNLPRQQRPVATVRFADAGYFETMGIRLAEGRLLEEADQARAVAVISARAAGRLWPGLNPLGKRFRHGQDDSPLIEVVGVVGDVRTISLTQDPPLHIYRPAAAYFYGRAGLAVKTRSDAAAIGPAIQQIVRELDPELAVPTPRTMEDIVTGSVAQRRFQTTLMLILGAVAAFLAALGIYGVVSQAAAQRTAEFGVRMALGADWRTILGLVLRGAMRPVMLGLIAGIAVSLGAGRLLRSLLFGVTPTEAMPFVVATLLLVSVALAASLMPAWRAARVDPIVALRYD